MKVITGIDKGDMKEFKWWETKNFSSIMMVKEYQDYFKILSMNNPDKVVEYIKSNSIPLTDMIRLIDFMNLIVEASKDSVNLLKEIANERDVLEGKNLEIENGRLTAASVTNEKRIKAVDDRRKKIKEYLEANPNLDTKGFSLEGYLTKVLELRDSKGKELSSKTIGRDLIFISLDKR
jgi:hypothetical protein